MVSAAGAKIWTRGKVEERPGSQRRVSLVVPSIWWPQLTTNPTCGFCRWITLIAAVRPQRTAGTPSCSFSQWVSRGRGTGSGHGRAAGRTHRVRTRGPDRRRPRKSGFRFAEKIYDCGSTAAHNGTAYCTTDHLRGPIDTSPLPALEENTVGGPDESAVGGPAQPVFRLWLHVTASLVELTHGIARAPGAEGNESARCCAAWGEDSGYFR